MRGLNWSAQAKTVWRVFWLMTDVLHVIGVLQGEDEAPPALPSEPPPAPNWTTFPSPSGGGAADSMLDASDVLPDAPAATEVWPPGARCICASRGTAAASVLRLPSAQVQKSFLFVVKHVIRCRARFYMVWFCILG